MNDSVLQSDVSWNAAPPGPRVVASRITDILKSIELSLMRIARRRILSCVLIGALALVARLALVRVDPIPDPALHDEFSYIFGGQTFAEGRLTNPTHPMWRFFETYHINMQPTFASKYPPAQSLFLAVGIRFFGHPWYGVLISVAFMCGCICWMLQGWLPPKYALLGGLLAILHFGIANYWIDSYFGGAVATIGGALVFGALPRLARSGSASAACAAAFGVAILANSRPFEGLTLVLFTFSALLWWTRGRFRVWFHPASVLPFGAILLCTFGAMGYYNLKVTGSPITFPYSVNKQRYAVSPLLWILPRSTPQHRDYRDSSMRDFWESGDVSHYDRIRGHPIYAVYTFVAVIRATFGAGAGLTLMFLFVCALPLVMISRMRLALIVLVLSLGAIFIDKYMRVHYLAPMLGGFYIIAMFGLRLLRCHRLGQRRPGRALAASVLAVGGVLFFFDALEMIHLHRTHDGTDLTPLGFRRRVDARLGAEPGKHLVLVRYAPDHNALFEIIYNTPDVDLQKTVWAFDFGPAADQPLLDYYRDRKVWLARPDGLSPTLETYKNY